MKVRLRISENDVLHVNARTWARPIADGALADGTVPTVFVHVGGWTHGLQDDGIGPAVIGQDAELNLDLPRAVELRDHLSAVIAELEDLAVAAPAAGAR